VPTSSQEICFFLLPIDGKGKEKNQDSVDNSMDPIWREIIHDVESMITIILFVLV